MVTEMRDFLSGSVRFDLQSATPWGVRQCNTVENLVKVVAAL